MAIVQDAFYIPDDIATGLATGLYRRMGGVVRYAVGPRKGQIVKHLKPIDIKAAEQAQGVGTKIIRFMANHKKGAGIAAVGVAAVGAGILGYTTWKNHEPAVLTNFRAALKVYIEAIRMGDMDIEKIDNLMNTLEELKKYKNYKKICIQFTTEELEILVGRIYEYTVKLAEDNSVVLTEDELSGSKDDDGSIIDLQKYLKVQKRIFSAVA